MVSDTWVEIENIKNRVLEGESIEDVLSRFHWRAFESAIAEIFEANGFSVLKNMRFKNDRRHEIDIVASKRGVNCHVVLCVDCKGWRGGRYKKGALSRAAENQAMRTESFEKFVSRDRKIRDILKVEKNPEFFPVIVTLLEEHVCVVGDNIELNDDVFGDVLNDLSEDLLRELVNDVLIIPVCKLNSFLNSFFKFYEL